MSVTERVATAGPPVGLERPGAETVVAAGESGSTAPGKTGAEITRRRPGAELPALVAGVARLERFITLGGLVGFNVLRSVLESAPVFSIGSAPSGRLPIAIARALGRIAAPVGAPGIFLVLSLIIILPGAMLPLPCPHAPVLLGSHAVTA